MYRIALLVALLLSTQACRLAPVPLGPARAGVLTTRSESTSLYPLVPGARWEYQLLQRQDDGPARERAMAIRVLSAAPAAAGGTEAVLEREYESWAPPPTRVRRHEDRVVLSRLSDPPEGPSITILRFPLAPGDEWPGRPLDNGHRETIRPRGAESVETPSGRHLAQRVDHDIVYATGGGDTLSYWYAQGIGVVKMIERSTVMMGGQAVKLEVTGLLKRYEADTPPVAGVSPERASKRRAVGLMPLD